MSDVMPRAQRQPQSVDADALIREAIDSYEQLSSWEKKRLQALGKDPISFY